MTQASFDAVKLPGEFSRCDRHLSLPSLSIASLPMSTALESHQMMASLTGLPFLSRHTSPCIWYVMPMLRTSASEYCSFILSMLSQTCFHHSSGFCSAHPGARAVIGISVSGLEAEQRHFPLSVSRRAALAEDDPMSMPKLFIWFELSCYVVNCLNMPSWQGI